MPTNRLHPDNHTSFPAVTEELEYVADKLDRDPVLAREKYGDFLCDIASKAQHYKMTEAQAKAAQKALRSRSELEEVPDVGKRRVGISGEVMSLKEKEGRFGPQLKMLVKTRMVDGKDVTCKLYGTVPADIKSRVAEGAKVSFTAGIDKSDKDPKFGFFGDPRDAEFEGDTMKASAVVTAVKDTSGKCGHLTYNAAGDELICIANKHDGDEPHEYLAYEDVAALLSAADDATEASLALTKKYEEGMRSYPVHACAECGQDGKASPEHIFDALGNPPWEYDPSVPEILCDCCGERIEAHGVGPVLPSRRCDGEHKLAPF